MTRARGFLGAAIFLYFIIAHRVPLFFADVDVHNATVLDASPLGPGTGWGRVPTPMF